MLIPPPRGAVQHAAAWACLAEGADFSEAPRRLAPPAGETSLPSPSVILEAAAARGDVPFAIGLVAGPEGVLWDGAAGEAAPGRAAAADTVLRLFSVTKAVGAVAAAILVERGLIGLDDPVGAALPAFDALPVLDGWDGGTPRLRPQRSRATLRQLLAHTSGAAYAVWHPGIARFNAGLRLPSPRSGVRRALELPLAFDPGTGWAYGTGLDWAGLLIEAVDGRPPEVFCREEIFAPLGMTETVFEVPAPLAARLADCWQRTPEGGLVRTEVPLVSRPEFWGLGHGLTGTGADLVRFLRMLLGRGTLEGTRLLSAPMVEELLAEQLGGRRLGAVPTTDPLASAAVGPIGGVPTGHSLIGRRNAAAMPGRRAAGAQGWAGLLNTHWWLDPARGRAGLFLTQCRPFFDPRVMAVLEDFERAAYDL